MSARDRAEIQQPAADYGKALGACVIARREKTANLAGPDFLAIRRLAGGGDSSYGDVWVNTPAGWRFDDLYTNTPNGWRFQARTFGAELPPGPPLFGD